VAADEDLVSVLQGTPLHAPAVDVDAVERAVVEDPDAALLVGDQRVAARDGGVVEADVGGERAADARPLAADRDDVDAPVLLEGEIAAGAAEPGPRLLEPGRRLGPRGHRARADTGEGPGALSVDVETWVHQDSSLPGSVTPPPCEA
jgi:hypothetical protein